MEKEKKIVLIWRPANGLAPGKVIGTPPPPNKGSVGHSLRAGDLASCGGD